jgi:DNA repair exonuclease SbcCD ATPase subunit
MKFPKLYIRNFLTIGEATIGLAGKGLVLIQGDNKDDSSATSNGAGKSTIADALCWCLYGVTARGKSGDGVVNNTHKKDCVVQVEVLDGATTYLIERYRKHAEFKNQLRVLTIADGGAPLSDLSLGTDKETQALVEKILGCSYEVFRAAIYSGQEDMPDLPGMTDRNLKLLIEQAAGIERIERAYELGRQRHRDAEGCLAAANSSFVKVRENITQTEARITDLTVRRDEWTAKQAAKIVEVHKALAAVGERFKAQFAKVTALDEAGRREALAAEELALAGWNDLQEKRKVLESSLGLRRSEETRLSVSAANLAERVKDSKQNVAHAIDGKCPGCGRPHTKEEIEKILAREAELMATYKEALRSAIENRDRNRDEVERISKEIAAIDAQPKPDGTLKRIAALQGELAAIGAQKRELLSLKSDYERLKAQLTGVEGETNPYEGLIDKERAMIVALRGTEKEQEKTVAQWVDTTAVYADVVKVFGPAGVRAHILDTVTPFLNDRTAEYLAVLSDGNIQATWTTLTRTKAGELKEKFTIEVSHAKGGDDFASISGGEKRKVRIATMLALQDLVAGRATKPIDLWIGDEIDDALDPAGLERFMAILTKRATERGTVLVVSHNELRDWIDQVLLVTKEPGGISRVEGALCVA